MLAALDDGIEALAHAQDVLALRGHERACGSAGGGLSVVL